MIVARMSPELNRRPLADRLPALQQQVLVYRVTFQVSYMPAIVIH